MMAVRHAMLVLATAGTAVAEGADRIFGGRGTGLQPISAEYLTER